MSGALPITSRVGRENLDLLRYGGEQEMVESMEPDRCRDKDASSIYHRVE